MANLTYDTEVAFSGLVRKTYPYVITNALQLYTGQLLMLTTGLAARLAPAAGTVCIGVGVAGGVPGSNPVLDGFNLQVQPIPSIGPGNVTTAASGNANEVIVEQGEFTANRVRLAVAGTLVGTVADVGKALFAATSNLADLSTTQILTDKQIGEVSKFYPGSLSGGFATYDVLVYSYEARKGL